MDVPVIAQEPSTDTVRIALPTADIVGKGWGRNHNGKPRSIDLQIAKPYEAWLHSTIHHDGSRVFESVGYDSILNSLYVDRDLSGRPERIEIQMMDSLVRIVTFHPGTHRIAEVGTMQKYYGRYTDLRCLDQEDSTFVATEMHCACIFSDVLMSWNEPCNAPIGECIQYWPNGSIKARGHFHPKEFIGVRNSDVRFEGETYAQQVTRTTRVKVGSWDYFDEHGKLVETVTYSPVWIDPRKR